MQFNIIGTRKIWYSISGVVVALCLGAIAIFGFRLGIDFVEGALIELRFDTVRPDTASIEVLLEEHGLTGSLVQHLGEDSLLLRTKPLDPVLHRELLDAMEQELPDMTFEEVRFETIGPTISKELRTKSLNMVVGVMVAIILYLTWTFRTVSEPVASWKYGVIAVTALMHDVIVPAGVFAWLGKTMGVEVDTLFVTAMLTVMGFSVHDTIVVFDMVRETLAKGSTNFEKAVNDSVNKTLTRSINTSLTTLIVLASVYVFGGESVRFFSLAMMIGVLTGTYSSIFFASPLLYSWYKWQSRN